jgi:hypothetical protein
MSETERMHGMPGKRTYLSPPDFDLSVCHISSQGTGVLLLTDFFRAAGGSLTPQDLYKTGCRVE